MSPKPVSRRSGGRGSLSERFDRQALIQQLTQLDDELEDILAKRPQDLTESEVRRIAERRLALPASDDKETLHAFERAFFEAIYGNDSAERDGTGRLLAPEAKRLPNRAPVSALTPDGADLNQTVNGLAQKIADLAETHGTRDAVMFLQRGMAMIDQAYRNEDERIPSAHSTPMRSLIPDLKDDGVPGPKTRQALRRMTAHLGSPKIEEALSLGQFEGALRNLGRGAIANDIKQIAGDAFAPLFRDPESRPKKSISSEEGESLQMAVNDIGHALLGERVFKNLREDGVIGPKTAAALNRVLAAAGPRRLAEAMGRNLGFFLFEPSDVDRRSLLNSGPVGRQEPTPGKNFAG